MAVYRVVEESELAPEVRRLIGHLRRFCSGCWRYWPQGEGGYLAADDLEELLARVRELNASRPSGESAPTL